MNIIDRTHKANSNRTNKSRFLTNHIFFPFAILVAIFLPNWAFAASNTFLSEADDVGDLIQTVSGGDVIVVTSPGSISISDVNFTTPVRILASLPGKTYLENASISDSNNIIIEGFIFGPSEESTLLKIENSKDIQVLRNIFDHKNVKENQTSIVTTQASENISIGYNLFRDKNIGDRNGNKVTGSFIKTQFDEPEMTKNLHVFRNHFKNIAPFVESGSPAGDSDREAIAMGVADSQSVVTNNVVEYNLFENCDGENEIITVKTSGNIFRHNTFKNSMGSLSFRLGSDNQAHRNYFYGEGPSTEVTDDNFQTGGIRVYGKGHIISNNFMRNLTGESWRSPILIDSGDTQSSVGNDNHEVSTDVQVNDNTIVNSIGGIYLGSDNYSSQPSGVSIIGNTVVAMQGILFDDYAGSQSNVWSGNLAYATGNADAIRGSLNSSEVLVLLSEPSINAPIPLTAADVGPLTTKVNIWPLLIYLL